MSISSLSNVNNNIYTQLASGKQINSAADNAAGLSIAESLKKQSNGYEVSSNNAAAGQDMLAVAEGGLNSIMGSLQRMRELSVQASNTAVYSSDDISAMQDEIDQLKSSIQDTAKYTTFNTMELLDGSKADWNLATNPSGNGMTIQTANSTLASLGIENFDVTGNFSIDTIDEAISNVSKSLSSIGSQSNALTYAINYNDYAAHNLTAARSNIEDLDMAKAVSEKEQKRILNEYQLFFTKKKMEEEQKVTRLLQF